MFINNNNNIVIIIIIVCDVLFPTATEYEKIAFGKIAVLSRRKAKNSLTRC